MALLLCHGPDGEHRRRFDDCLRAPFDLQCRTRLRQGAFSFERVALPLLRVLARLQCAAYAARAELFAAAVRHASLVDRALECAAELLAGGRLNASPFQSDRPDRDWYPQDPVADVVEPLGAALEAAAAVLGAPAVPELERWALALCELAEPFVEGQEALQGRLLRLVGVAADAPAAAPPFDDLPLLGEDQDQDQRPPYLERHFRLLRADMMAALADQEAWRPVRVRDASSAVPGRGVELVGCSRPLPSVGAVVVLPGLRAAAAVVDAVPEDAAVLLEPIDGFEFEVEAGGQVFEVPDLFYPAYGPVLEALRALHPASLPLARQLAEGAPGERPAYLAGEVDVAAATHSGRERRLPARSTRELREGLRALGADLALDDAQADAFAAALTTDVALVQGPPGTGKTFLGARLVRALPAAPVLVVCLTNRALDDFVASLGLPLETVVRIGGRSRRFGERELWRLASASVAERRATDAPRAEVRAAARLRVLRGARIVAATTAGAAREHRLLRALGPRCVVVEEAGEVLEAHVLAALSPRTAHLVLIGDHLQLRPRIHSPALRGVLDRSLFERLAERAVPLRVQWRMRPALAELARLTYPSLLSAEAVRALPERPVLWCTHAFAAERRGRSWVNEAEAAAVCSVASAAGADVVLTPYAAQVGVLRGLGLPLPVSTIDDFQGDEADVVVVSLVVSGRIGFLAEDNRVNVMVTRARCGLVIVGAGPPPEGTLLWRVWSGMRRVPVGPETWGALSH